MCWLALQGQAVVARLFDALKIFPAVVGQLVCAVPRHEYERAGDVDVSNINVPVPVRGERLNKTFALARLLATWTQHIGLTQNVVDCQSSIAFQRMLIVEFDDCLLFVIGQPVVLPRCAFRMTVQLSKELAAALHACGELQLEVVDPVTSRVYFIVESETHRQAMAALRARQDRDAIAQGLAEMEAGQGVTVEEAFGSIRTRLGLRRRRL
jgi:hypothetical protein